MLSPKFIFLSCQSLVNCSPLIAILDFQPVTADVAVLGVTTFWTWFAITQSIKTKASTIW